MSRSYRPRHFENFIMVSRGICLKSLSVVDTLLCWLCRKLIPRGSTGSILILPIFVIVATDALARSAPSFMISSDSASAALSNIGA